MIKISISKGQTQVTFEADGHELKAAMVDAFDLFKQIQESNPVLPFEEKLQVKEIKPGEKVKLTEEELDMIEKAKEEANKRREESEKEMATAQIEIAKAAEAKRAADDLAKKQALAAKKEADDAENEARKARAKARKKRDFLYQAADMDGEVTSEMIAKAASDAEETKEDADAQAIYDQTYSTPQAAAPVVKEKEVKQSEAIAPPKKKEQEAAPAQPAEKTETETKVEEKEEGSDAPKTKAEVMEEIKLMFNSGKNENKQALKLARKGVDMLKAVGVERCEAMVDIMTNITIQKTLWDMLSKRPEVMVAKLGYTKAEAEQIIELMN